MPRIWGGRGNTSGTKSFRLSARIENFWESWVSEWGLNTNFAALLAGPKSVVASTRTRTYVTPYSFSGTFSATFSCFVMGNIFFAFLDYFQWPTFLYKYKIQKTKQLPRTYRLRKILRIMDLWDYYLVIRKRKKKHTLIKNIHHQSILIILLQVEQKAHSTRRKPFNRRYY